MVKNFKNNNNMNRENGLDEIKKFHKDFLYIVIDIAHLGSDEWAFCYIIKYLPKEAQNLKRRGTAFKEVESFFENGSTYVGAWYDYDHE
jgi:hypothetical protein